MSRLTAEKLFPADNFVAGVRTYVSKVFPEKYEHRPYASGIMSDVYSSPSDS
jgi:hypothetical protein